MWGKIDLKSSMLTLTTVIAAAAFIALSGCYSKNDTAKQQVEVGDLVPEFRLPKLDDGTLYSSQALTGNVLVLNFWASWCAPCRKEMPSLQRLAEALEGEPIKVLGISVDDDANLAKEFLRKYNITFNNLHDPGQQQTARHFAISAYPETLIISPDGKIVRKILGEQVWDNQHMISLLQNISMNKTNQKGSYVYRK